MYESSAGMPEMLTMIDDNDLLPSAIAVPTNEGGGAAIGVAQCAFGEAALRQMGLSNKVVITGFKRLMGKQYKALPAELMHTLPYQVVETETGGCGIQIQQRVYPPEYFAGLLFLHIKQTVEAQHDLSLKEAVFTIPAGAEETQRQSLLQAAEIAQIRAIRVIHEPTAAAIAYGLGRYTKGYCLVYDLGGGTFDATLIEIHQSQFKVICTLGDLFVGGKDIDRLVVHEFVQAIGAQDPEALQHLDAVALRRLQEEARKAKERLSEQEVVDVSVPYLTATPSGTVNFQHRLTRQRLEELAAPVIEKTMGIVHEVMQMASLRADRVDNVILVGGASQMPLVYTSLAKYFGKAPLCTIKPKQVVAIGAAYHAANLSLGSRKYILFDKIPLSLGVESEGGHMSVIIPAQSDLPCAAQRQYQTTEDWQSEVRVSVFQGNRPIARANRHICDLHLQVPPLPKGVAKISVQFVLDANGVLHVTASSGGTQASLSTDRVTDVAEEEIVKLREEAQRYAKLDERVLRLKRLSRQAHNARDLMNNMRITGPLREQLEKVAEEISCAINHYMHQATDDRALTKIEAAPRLRSVEALEERMRQINSALSKLYTENLNV